MYISKIHLQNYRNFNDFTMEFHKGLNVIIGANNSGKTGLLYAIRLLSSPSDITIDDFNKNNLLNYSTLYKESAPSILVEYYINHTICEDDYEDESIIRLLPFLGIEGFADTRREEGGKVQYDIRAKIKALFSLDPRYMAEYKAEVHEVTDFEKYISILARFVEKHYSWVYTNGLSDTKADQKDITSIFDIRFIGAERTSEEVRKETKREIDRFIKDPAQIIALDEFKAKVSNDLKNILSPTIAKFVELFENENNEIGLKKGNVAIASTIKANINASDAYLTEVKDTKGEYSIPLDHNGLGYNNLINIYMLIKLNEIKKGRDFRILCLEEPEAHLHPAMQYKLFKYLRDLDKEDKLNQQIFVTTHSSNISAVAGLDNMFMLAYNRSLDPPECEEQSLEKQFDYTFDIGNHEGETIKERKLAAKKHLSKFLDVTRSDMLFSDKVILVEGIAEKLLMPAFMSKCGIPYEDEHISIVEIGGKHFEHFIELFNGNKVKKKILCITDRDFSWLDDDSLSSIENYNSHEAPHLIKLNNLFSFDEFKIVTQSGYGRTFEDELFLSNIENDESIKELLKIVVPNSLFAFVEKYGFDLTNWQTHIGEIDGRVRKTVDKFILAYNNRIDKADVNNTVYNRIIISELFLHYSEPQKGDLALQILTDDTFTEESGVLKLNVPEYIAEGLEWLKN